MTSSLPVTSAESVLSVHLSPSSSSSTTAASQPLLVTPIPEALIDREKLDALRRAYASVTAAAAAAHGVRRYSKKHTAIMGPDGLIIKPYQCDTCSKSFTTKSYFTQHMQMHREGKSLCTVCNKSFTVKWYLQDHMRLHTGEKPYTCHICDKAFSFRSHLDWHRSKHTDNVVPQHQDLSSLK